ncbi:MAG: outer membrane beta-barrel family protein [Bacteroidia bacterium]
MNYWENSDQIYTETVWLPGQTMEMGTVERQKAVNDEYENQYLIQVDYLQPIGEEGKLEAGLRSSFRDMTNDYLVTDEVSPEVWVPNALYDNIFVYNENIHAVYGILGNKGKKISYQVGLRAEMTDVKTTLKETNEVNPRNYSNLFPSAHFSYHLPGNNDLQISYSRRVRRPTYRELSPFITLSDGRNFFSGNPDLNPEFTHALEMGYLKYFEKGSLASSVYYRNASSTIQDIRRIDSTNGFTNRLPENLNGQQAFGVEMAFGYNLYKWWKLDASFNFFRAITDGTNIDATFSSDTYSWFIRQTSRFTLPKQISIQLRANYDAPELTPQGKRKAIYYFDLAIQKDIWKRKGRITLNATDVLNSRIYRNTFEGDNYFSDVETQFQRRQINLSLSYRIR